MFNLDKITKDVVITADSPCDLPKNIIDDRNIIITPLTILLGNNSYNDGVNIQPNDIYHYVDMTGILPKTAALSPSIYCELFEYLTKAGKQVVHIGLSSGISSTFHNAQLAASEFDDVYCIDSKALCTAMGLLVLKACDLRDEGLNAQQICEKLNDIVPKISTTFIVNSLDYLHKGGRCSGVAKFGANVLGIKPSIIANLDDGTLSVGKKYRGKINMVYKQYVNDCLADSENIDKSRVVIANSGGIDEETLKDIRKQVKSLAKFDETIFADAGCTISSHCGPGTLAIFYIKK